MLKEKPEDFVVEELPIKFSNDGDNYIYLLTKEGLSTHDCLKIISRIVNIPVKKIGYAGLKDKQAITKQYLSFPKKLKDIEEEHFTLTFISKHDDRLNLGSLIGNKFTILLRNYTGVINKISFIPNYFDEQRFSKTNFEVGLALLKKDFKKACELADEYSINEYLEIKPNDYIGALKTLKRRVLMLYVHAVQSRIFNELLSEYIRRFKHFEVDYSQGKLVFPKINIANNFDLPLPGFDCEDDKAIETLTTYGLTPRSFIISSLPNISSEGTIRKAFVEIKDLEIKTTKQGTKISFELGKGSYATIVVKALVSS